MKQKANTGMNGMNQKEYERFILSLGKNKLVKLMPKVMDKVWCDFAESWKDIDPLKIYYSSRREQRYVKVNAVNKGELIQVLCYEDGLEEQFFFDDIGMNTLAAIASDRNEK
jgi:hypothetical protein